MHTTCTCIHAMHMPHAHTEEEEGHAANARVEEVLLREEEEEGGAGVVLLKESCVHGPGYRVGLDYRRVGWAIRRARLLGVCRLALRRMLLTFLARMEPALSVAKPACIRKMSAAAQSHRTTHAKRKSKRTHDARSS